MKITLSGTRTGGVDKDVLTFEDIGPDEVTVSIDQAWTVVSRDALVRALRALSSQGE